MKEFQKGVLDNDRVISAGNVQRMGEVIALCAIKTVIVRGGKDLHNLYKGLLHDVNRSENDMSRYSDGYDIAQEAMLFLCQHMGKRLDAVYYTKTGRKITIKQACFSVADRYLAKNYVAPMLNTTSLNEQIMTESEAILDDEQKNDYTAFDGLISKMHLTAAEHETLSILMAGFTMLFFLFEKVFKIFLCCQSKHKREMCNFPSHLIFFRADCKIQTGQFLSCLKNFSKIFNFAVRRVLS